MSKVLLYISLFFGFVYQSYGQDEEEPTIPAVAVLSRPLPDSILLRWGPTTPMAWELSIEQGYQIERTTILRNDQLLDSPDKILLTPEPILPWSFAQWEPLADSNDYAAVAGQAIFGETFEVTENMSSDMMQVVNKVKELEMRFSFALFAADQSIAVANASGLYFVDRNVKKGEKYLYKVYSTVPKETLNIDTGYVYVGIMDYNPLPSPMEMNATSQDRAVEISWNSENYYGIYNSFHLERADDGAHFNQVNEKPIVNTYKGDRPNSRLTFRVDSLPEYNKEYLYRVRGITPFGEIGPPSDTVAVIALEVNELNPVITEKISPDNETMQITWDFEQNHEGKIKGFSVLRTADPKAPYDTIAQSLPPNQRTFIDQSPELANYYVVAAEDQAGNFKNSFPALAQLIDSIPPIAPSGLVGHIDTTGLVSLNWIPNTENDIWGYRVYRANYAEEEYSQITVSPVTTTIYHDTIPLKNLTPQIFYKLMAVDKRGNASIFSDSLRLIKPDMLPPVPPVVEQIESSEKGVHLTIIPSSSADVVQHLVYRKNINQSHWELVQQFDSLKTKITYTDTSLSNYKPHLYTILAIDLAGLESERSRPVEGNKIDNGMRDEIKNIFAQANREERYIQLEWKYERQGIDKFMIYKSHEDQDYRLYKTYPANTMRAIDRSLKINTVYKYKVMAVYKSGARSPLSKEVKVNY